VSFKAQTSVSGAYAFEAIQSGSYSLGVEAPGFRKFSSKNNVVTIGQPATINVRQYLGGIKVFDSNDISTYHALEARVAKTFAKGVTARFAYTFSKAPDTRSWDPSNSTVSTGNSQSAASTPFDIYNRKLNYGVSDFDRPHVIQSDWVVELPFGHGKKFGSGAAVLTSSIFGRIRNSVTSASRKIQLGAKINF